MIKFLITAIMLVQAEPLEAPRPVSWTTYQILRHWDRFAESANTCIKDLSYDKVNVKACKEMHKDWRALQALEGWPKK